MVLPDQPTTLVPQQRRFKASRQINSVERAPMFSFKAGMLIPGLWFAALGNKQPVGTVVARGELPELLVVTRTLGDSIISAGTFFFGQPV